MDDSSRRLSDVQKAFGDLPLQVRSVEFPANTPETQRRRQHDEQMTEAHEQGAVSREVRDLLAETHRLAVEQAVEQGKSKVQADADRVFNRRMQWTTVLLAGAAVVVPFIVLWIS
jgi:hypothetical protein